MSVALGFILVGITIKGLGVAMAIIGLAKSASPSA